MKSTERENVASAPAVSDDELDRLRETFYARLHRDRIRLTTLAALLARIEGNPAGVFQELQGLAHRIRGAAGVFQVPEVFSAASALEQAATVACSRHADHTDGSVWSALEELVERLAMTSGTGVATTQDFKSILQLSEIADRAAVGTRNTKHRQAKHR